MDTRSHMIEELNAPSGAVPADADRSLMHRVANGDEDALGDLYDRFGALVFKMSVQVLNSRAEAEDAVQEIFVRLWRTSDKYDVEKAALVTWVMLLTRRHLVDRLRRTKARPKIGSIDRLSWGEHSGAGPSDRDASVAPDRLEQDERFSGLMKRVMKLPDLQQTVVVRSYLGGQTLRQIADELHVPLGTVKSALSRALVRLRETLPGDPET